MKVLQVRTRLRLVLNLGIAVITTIAAIGMLLIIFWFEDSLFYNHLQSDLVDYINTHKSSQKVMKTELRDTTYFQFPDADPAILPEIFRGYPAGGHEILTRSHAYNLFVQYEDGWSFVLLQDQSEFERYELLAIACVVLGTLLILILNAIISRRLADQILSPISHLADEVKTMLSGEEPRQHYDYPEDETGQLAGAFRHYRVRVRELLMREQQFSANVSHELRTPMMVFRGALDMLEEDASAEQLTQQLPRMNAALLQMQQQMELFLQLSRTPDSLSTAGKMANIDQIAYQQIGYWDAFARARGLSLGVQLNARSIPCLPEASVVAVLNNLLRNAVQHTIDGGVMVDVGDNYLSVCDTGVGLAPQRFDALKARGAGDNPEGFGIGLAIVERICQHQGWHLSISENQPKGTCVRVDFVAL